MYNYSESCCAYLLDSDLSFGDCKVLSVLLHYSMPHSHISLGISVAEIYTELNYILSEKAIAKSLKKLDEKGWIKIVVNNMGIKRKYSNRNVIDLEVAFERDDDGDVFCKRRIMSDVQDAPSDN